MMILRSLSLSLSLSLSFLFESTLSLPLHRSLCLHHTRHSHMHSLNRFTYTRCLCCTRSCNIIIIILFHILYSVFSSFAFCPQLCVCGEKRREIHFSDICDPFLSVFLINMAISLHDPSLSLSFSPFPFARISPDAPSDPDESS